MSAVQHDGQDTDPPPGFTVRGGPATRVRWEDLSLAADALRRAADALDAADRRVRDLHAAVEVSAGWSPATARPAANALAPLLSASLGARAVADDTLALARALDRAAEEYRRAELDVGALVRATVQGSVAAAASRGPVGLLGGALRLLALGSVGVQTLALAHVTTRGATLLAASPTPAGMVLRLNPWTRPLLLEGRLARATWAPLGGLPRTAVVEVGVVAAATALTGVLPGPAPRDPVRAAAGVLHTTVTLPARLRGEVTTPAVGPVVERRPVEPPPRDAAEVLADVAADYPPYEGADGTVSVRRVDHPDGARSWVVTIPGTQDWSPVAGDNPADLTSDLALMAGRADDATAAVVAALAQSGIGRDEPVLLAGHSLGGMVAVGIAADPLLAARYTFAGVLTAGSPVGSMTLPADVQALHLEHPHDDVPALDGGPNPDASNRVTVTRDLTRSAHAADRVAADGPVGAHRVGTYVRSAATMDRVEDERLEPFRAVLDRVLGLPGSTSVVTRYTAARVSPSGPPG